VFCSRGGGCGWSVAVLLRAHPSTLTDRMAWSQCLISPPVRDCGAECLEDGADVLGTGTRLCAYTLPARNFLASQRASLPSARAAIAAVWRCIRRRAESESCLHTRCTPLAGSRRPPHDLHHDGVPHAVRSQVIFPRCSCSPRWAPAATTLTLGASRRAGAHRRGSVSCSYFAGSRSFVLRVWAVDPNVRRNSIPAGRSCRQGQRRTRECPKYIRGREEYGFSQWDSTVIAPSSS